MLVVIIIDRAVSGREGGGNEGGYSQDSIPVGQWSPEHQGSTGVWGEKTRPFFAFGSHLENNKEMKVH